MCGRLVLLCIATLTLTACVTTPKSCRSLDNRAMLFHEFERASITQLQCAADQGVIASQVLLAKRYETGDGVTRDLDRAVSLYERAATPIPSTTTIYSPPVRVGGRGQVMLLPNLNAGPGSGEAQYRLGRLLLEGRGVTPDPKRGRELIERAAKQGYAPAIKELSGSAR